MVTSWTASAAALALGLAAILASPAGGLAEEPARAECAAPFPVARQRALLTAADVPVVESGSGLFGPGRAVELRLVPQSQVPFAHAPGKPLAPDPVLRGGVVALEVRPPGGMWEIAISHAAWVDVVQAGALVPVAAFAGVHDCAGLRKVLRFPLASGTALLQFSGASTERLRVLANPLD